MTLDNQLDGIGLRKFCAEARGRIRPPPGDKATMVLFNHRYLSIAFALLASSLPCTSFASETAVGVTINGTTGEHVEQNSVGSVPFIPLPILEADYKQRQFNLHLEGVPPIGPVGLVGRNTFARAQARVTYLGGDLSFTLPGKRYAFGLGETILNQRTSFAPNAETQASRVVGIRYVVRVLLYAGQRQQLQADLAFSPHLHGVLLTTFTEYALTEGGQTRVISRAFADPEHGSIVDASLRWSIPHDRSTFSYGLRYINYTAAYDRRNFFADRNHLLMPFFGFAVRLNRR